MKKPKLIVGNWKMNGLYRDSLDRIKTLVDLVKTADLNKGRIVLCPPATLIASIFKAIEGSSIACGGQDCHAEPHGAFTGDISAEMLKDLGCRYVIAGHSERRQYHRETSEQVAAKARAAHRVGLTAIICVGETDQQRTDGKASEIVSEQLKASVPTTASPENTVIAYEPVWAIGTGKVASVEDVVDMHAIIHRLKPELQILYGGSVKASNAGDILGIPNVDGVLVGGASLKADEFSAIALAA